jgi:DNA-binding CsgD family transcriptional regulator
MLVGRRNERARIDRFLDELRDARGGTLVLRGEAGIGKTSLLEYAIEHAANIRVLRAVGVESEGSLPFSGLHELIHPLLGLLDELAEPQARALRGALAVEDVPVLNRFSVYAATLGLLLAEAERQPLLCVVDDAHWLDAASVEAMLFAARRLRAERVGMLFSARDPHARVFSAPGVPEMYVGGLEPSDARTLVAANARDRIAQSVIEQLIRVTEGNPLALLEIPAALDDRQRAGLEPLDEPLPVSRRVERAFTVRAASLSPEARSALLLVAASHSHETDEVRYALAAEGIGPNALREAEAEGLLIIGAELRFSHPLARSAIYKAASPSERRSTHRRLAEVTNESDRRAWHLAAATLHPDEEVAAALKHAAETARRRGGVSAEALALERAARLTPDNQARARRLLGAGLAAEAAGWLEVAERLLAEAADLSSDPTLRAEAISKRSYVLFDRGKLGEAYDLAMGEFDRLEESQPKIAAAILVGSGVIHVLHHRLDIEAAASMAERARKLAGYEGRTNLDLCHMLAWTRALLGAVSEAAGFAQSCRDHVDASTVVAVDIATDLIYLEQYTGARDLLEAIVSHNRDVGALEILAYALDQLARVQFRSGDLTRAYLTSLESVQLTEPLGNDVALAASLAWLALLEAALGRDEDSESHATRALGIAATRDDRWNIVRARSALGFAALSSGNVDEAVEWLEPAARMLEEGSLRHPNFFRIDADLIEAEVRLGSKDQAQAHLSRLEQQAQATGSPWANAVAARCRALLASKDDVDDAFLLALALHQRDPSEFERARTQLSFGESLRRRGYRRQAREQLHGALETFERLGSRPWTKRVRSELRATGETLQRRGSKVQEELTPQELQIALSVAEGKTNREVGARLFLSPKTVEFHLSHVYRKLGVRSRAELAGLLAKEQIGGG